MATEPENIDVLPGRVSLNVSLNAMMLNVEKSPLEITGDDALKLARALTDAAATSHAEVAIDEDDNDNPKRIPMQFIVMEVERDPDAEGEKDSELPDEAQVLCWIKEQSHNNALHVAVGCVNETDWIVTSVLEHRSVSAKDFADTDLQAFYEEALTDDEVFVYDASTPDEE
jgi:hypothetical protein